MKSSQENRWYSDYLPVTAGGLGLARIAVALTLLFFLIPGDGSAHYRFLSDLPSGFYAPPPGPMQLLGQFPPFPLFVFLHSLILFSGITMLIGYRTRISSLLCGFTLLLLQGILFSVGKIDHEILVPLIPIVMAFSNWGAAWSADALTDGRVEEVQSWPLALMALFIGFMMFTAGFPKLMGGWLDPTTQAAQSHVLNQFYGRGRQDLFATFAAGSHQPFLWELLDWFTVLFELLFLAALFKPAWFRIFLALAVLFHTGTMLTMNIAFLPNFAAYLLFLNWDGVNQAVSGAKCSKTEKSEVQNRRGYLRVILATILLLLFFTLLTWAGRSGLWIGDSDLQLHEIVLVGMAALYVAGKSIHSVIRYCIDHLP